MRIHAPSLSAVGLAAAFLVVSTTGICFATPANVSTPSHLVHAAPAVAQLAQADSSESRDSQPCCEAAARERKGSFNDEYVFGLTRGIADSDMHPAAKILVFPMTVPFDFVLLPFEVIGGLF